MLCARAKSSVRQTLQPSQQHLGLRYQRVHYAILTILFSRVAKSRKMSKIVTFGVPLPPFSTAEPLP